jgi:endoglucanase
MVAVAFREGKMGRTFWPALAPALFVLPTLSAELVANGGLDSDTTGWWATQNLTIAVTDGQLCTLVPGGLTNPWDAIVGVNDIGLVKGESYEFAFSYGGDPGGPVRALVQMPVDPYASYTEATPRAGREQKSASRKFKAPVDRPDAQIVFQIGGAKDAWTFCLDNVSLSSGSAVEAYRADTGPRIRVNQLGYLPDGPKRATLVANTGMGLPFKLLDANGAVLFEGRSKTRGPDPTAGAKVQVLDFTEITTPGHGLTIEIDGEKSYPFNIDAKLYSTLAIDSLSYFYPVRSGIEIDPAIAGEGYGRPAGHVSSPVDGALNKGDKAVPCQPAEASQAVYGEPWTCDYTLDVTGGWYDAGDHGKYVVNGGISVVQLLAAYSWRDWQNDPPSMADGALRIPETGNQIPDILDEAKWEVDWMLKMVVPSGEFAGMVHHKIHDSQWTGIPLLPSNDDKPRELHRPSTAATLNLSAVASMAMRAFLDITPQDAYPNALADALTLRATAVNAYYAAKKHPDLFAPADDGNSGGGPYDDSDLSDEFYWAAVELYISFGGADKAMLTELKASPHWDGPVFGPGGFDWGHVAGFARLDLARSAGLLPDADAAMVVQSVLDGADALLTLQANEPFGQTYSPSSGKYEWGSNHLIIQNAIVLATAYDLSKDKKYRDGALEAMDYIFGRNALNRSYVTGYGTVYSHNQHSRWFAKSANADLPEPPKGSLAGGPNSSIQDPVAQALFAEQGCAPQLCYVDDIQSWSTNEITINWNAALGQMATWLAEQ